MRTVRAANSKSQAPNSTSQTTFRCRLVLLRYVNRLGYSSSFVLQIAGKPVAAAGRSTGCGRARYNGLFESACARSAGRLDRRAPMNDPTIPYRALLETLPVAAYLCDAEGLLTY